MYMKKRVGGFTLLKYIAAFQVMFGHLTELLHLEQWEIRNVSVVPYLLSPFQGVPVFFALSGYFIWKNLSSRSTTPRQFAHRRFIRIFPELWIVVAFTALAILLVSHQSLDPVPFLAWIVTQATFLQFWTPDCLRDFGIGCPNGSLWTIPIFLQFYIAVCFLHKLLHRRKKWVWCLALAVSALFHYIPGLAADVMPEALYKLYQQTLLPYLSVFLFAAFLAENEDSFGRFLNHKAVAAVLYLVLLIGLPFDVVGAGYPLFRSLLIVLFAISFGNSVRCGFLKQDISYEIYLVHMPIMNLLLELTGTANWGTFLLTAAASFLSAWGLYQANRHILQRLESHTS